ncbi:ABC transporter permease [Yeosuana sp.]|uniref:ABC transporter permease n=1 Tax=Yeosuana sp. TaxID=2529388 RepID=UPI004054B468|tara:strand:- start:401 stop:1603 length:1203 start_codon:yes stop_codon:yes gene_type:complete
MKNLFKTYYKAKISFWNSISTEWNAIIKDKAVVGIFLSIGFIILVVYTYIYSNQVVQEVPVAIVNQDATKLSRDYMSMLDASEGLKVMPNYIDLQEAKTAYYSKNVMGIIIIPKNFEKNIKQGKQTDVVTFSDASNMLFYKKVLGDVSVITGYFNAGIAIKKEMLQAKPYNQATQEYFPIKPISTSLFNYSSGYANYLIPILTALLVQLILLMAMGVLNGSRNEDSNFKLHFPRLLHSGGTIPVLLGKAFLYFMFFLIIIPIQIGIVYSIFNIPVRSPLYLIYLFLIPYIFAVIFLGITISSLFKKREDSIIFLVLISIPSLMLSGLSFPVQSFPIFYRYLAQLLPSTPGIDGFVKLTQMNASFFNVLKEWKSLWLLTCIYFVLAAISLKLRAINENKSK